MRRKTVLPAMLLMMFVLGPQAFASSYSALEGVYENSVLTLTVVNQSVYPTPGRGEESHSLVFEIQGKAEWVLGESCAIFFNNEWYRFSGENELSIILGSSMGDFRFILLYEVRRAGSSESVQIPVQLETDSGDAIPNPFGTSEMEIVAPGFAGVDLERILLSLVADSR